MDEGCLFASDLGEVGTSKKGEKWQEVKKGDEQLQRYLNHKGLKYKLVASGAALSFILYRLVY